MDGTGACVAGCRFVVKECPEVQTYNLGSIIMFYVKLVIQERLGRMITVVRVFGP